MNTKIVLMENNKKIFEHHSRSRDTNRVFVEAIKKIDKQKNMVSVKEISEMLKKSVSETGEILYESLFEGDSKK